MKAVRSLILFAAAAWLAMPAMAQEGHPLDGTWYGAYGTGGPGNDLTIVMDWDGKQVTGEIHPGPNAIPLTSVVLDITPGAPPPEGQGSTAATPPKFNVRFQANLPSAAGGTAPVVFEGMINNPVAGNRTITGSWTRGSERGTFEIRRL
jgi:hypothetical protein